MQPAQQPCSPATRPAHLHHGPAAPLLTLARPVQTSPARSHLLLVLPQRRTRSPSRACSHRQGEPRSSRSTSRDPLSVSPRRLLPPPAPSVPIARALKGSRSLSSSPLPPPSAELCRLCARAPCSTSSSPPLEPHRLGLTAGSSFCCCILSPTPLRAPRAPSPASPATWAFIPVFPASSVPPSCLCPLRAAAARRSAPWPLAPSSSCGSLTFLRHFALVF